MIVENHESVVSPHARRTSQPNVRPAQSTVISSLARTQVQAAGTPQQQYVIQPTRQPTVQRPPAGQFVIQQPQGGVIQLGQQPHYRRISTGDAQFVAGAQPVFQLLDFLKLKQNSQTHIVTYPPRISGEQPRSTTPSTTVVTSTTSVNPFMPPDLNPVTRGGQTAPRAPANIILSPTHQAIYQQPIGHTIAHPLGTIQVLSHDSSD